MTKTAQVKLGVADWDAVIFDLDGVVTKTARVHAAAWKRLFDEYLARRTDLPAEARRPFDQEDYLRYVDGKPRYDGVQSFLESRGITLPRGATADDPEAETVCGLGNKKNRIFVAELRANGVETFPSTVALIGALRGEGIKTAIISSSKNCKEVLNAAGLADRFDARVDGVESARLGLRGKPAAGIFLEAARRLGVPPERTVVVEDAVAGVQAGRRGGFGLVIGVERDGRRIRLRREGAHVVVSDLSEIALRRGSGTGPAAADLPSPLAEIKQVIQAMEGKRPIVFLDYDGTLTPIVERPEDAVLSGAMRQTLKDLARLCPVAIISGRDLPDVKALVAIDGLCYAGSHGFDMAGPNGLRSAPEGVEELVPLVDAAERELVDGLGDIAGTQVERKAYSVAVHYRRARPEAVPAVREAVRRALERRSGLRMTEGKKVFELQPAIDWHKGKALLWILRSLDMDGPRVWPLYLGDDITDEDAFRTLRGRGTGIVVGRDRRPTWAEYALNDPDEVGRFLERLMSAPLFKEKA